MSSTALLLSIFALTFTIFSFWWMNWRKGSLKISNIRTYAAVSSQNKLLIELPIIFFNPGALPVLVDNLRLTFPDRGGPHTALHFNATVEKLSTDEGRAFATPFAVHKGQALLKICEFQRLRSGFKFESQNYEIVIEALIGGAVEWKVIKTFQLKVRESQLKALNTIFVAHDNEPQLTQP
jgi:hypothetical protein